MKKKIWSIAAAAMLCCMMFAVGVSAETEGIYSYIVLNNKAMLTHADTTAEGDIVIPSTLGGYPVTDIGNNAFDDCTKVTSVTVPVGVKQIGNNAFENCKLMTSVSLSQGITKIGNYAFNDCIVLESITIPTTVTTIGSYAFQNCDKLTSVTVPQGVTSIGSYAFYDCDELTTVVIPESVTVINSYTFQSRNKLTSVTLPNSVTDIKSYAFASCSNLKTINLPTSLLTLGSYAFRSCSKLTSITIPNGTTSIGEWAFGYCSSLYGIAIPSSVTSIGHLAFVGKYETYKSAYGGTYYSASPLTQLTVYGYKGSYAQTHINGGYTSGPSIPFYSLGDVAEPMFAVDLSDTSCLIGETMTLSVFANAASVGEITYQWYVSDTPDGAGTAIDGATGPSYTVPTQSPSVGYYYVIATNTNGEHVATAQSASARISVGVGTIAQTPVINAQTSVLSCPLNENIALFISADVADGGALSYQWYESDSEDGPFTEITDATRAGYTPSTAVEGTKYYRVTVTNTNNILSILFIFIISLLYDTLGGNSSGQLILTAPFYNHILLKPFINCQL